jgi:hypothetical protein
LNRLNVSTISSSEACSRTAKRRASRASKAQKLGAIPISRPAN